MTKLPERFWARVYVGPETRCWLWKTPGLGGYGSFMLKRVRKYAHRWSYEELVGPIPADLEIDHLCRNRACVNPAHLEPVTRKINTQRGLAGKYPRKPKNAQPDE